ncbi:MAG: ABC transporter ATP-binding protein/permease [Oscillospiraceae bacterium]|nr:ABC transporter ATP-binding protein/permease [Oscillospiraceae bacterium]
MKHIGKILAKDWLAIVAIVLALVIQAYAELSLPQYTSDIVNTGIQQSGVVPGAPQLISADSWNRIYFLLDNDDDRAFLDSMYTKQTLWTTDGDADTSDGGEAYLLRDKDTYFAKEFTALHITGEVTDDNNNRIADILRTPQVLLYFMDNAANFSSGSDLGGDMGAEFSTLDPRDPNTLVIIKEKIDSIDTAITSQLAQEFVKSDIENTFRDIGAEESTTLLRDMSSAYILHAGLIMVAFAFIAMAASGVNTFFAAKVGSRFARDLRKAVFTKVLSFGSREYDSFSSASLITRSTNDIRQVQMTSIMFLRMLLYAPIVGVGALSKVLRQDTELSWVIVVSVGTLLGLVIVMFLAALPKFKIIQKLVDKLNLISREIINGIPVIRAFAREEHEKKRFEAANLDLTKVSLFINKAMSLMFPIMMLIMNGTGVLIIWAGAGYIDTGTLKVGDLMAFISYAMQILMAFLMISMMSIVLPRAMIAAGRIAEILNKEPSVHDPASPSEFDKNLRGTVEFNNVSFKYDGAEENALTDISFKSKPGEITAIIGSTGSGKTTLVGLILRFFDTTEGSVLVDGADVRTVSQKSLREKIGYVSQKAVLFSGTLATNIAYSDHNGEMTDDEVTEAAKTAQLTGFIAENEDGLEYEVSQAGSNLSGGQKQRVSIARALAKNPEVYIFDDSFSALDYKTDTALRKALRSKLDGATAIIIAQRIGTVINADRIVVLNEGRVVGIGKHSELMVKCDVYRDIAKSQLSSAELA